MPLPVRLPSDMGEEGAKEREGRQAGLVHECCAHLVVSVCSCLGIYMFSNVLYILCLGRHMSSKVLYFLTIHSQNSYIVTLCGNYIRELTFENGFPGTLKPQLTSDGYKLLLALYTFSNVLYIVI